MCDCNNDRADDAQRKKKEYLSQKLISPPISKAEKNLLYLDEAASYFSVGA
jgi:hypothetical protein